ncbi:MAG: hypothetical protein BEN19_04030 [Epulopiscium sp. Nuni2H_MBin003]|nr:MAG: hypothetical protein BEN19_04030 [Epulopiscium sp. Nuni2H_MBin003]
MENKVIAVVNNRNITELDMEKLLVSLGHNAPAFQNESGKKKLIDELVAQELLYSDAIDHNFDDEEQFKEALKEMEDTLLKQYALNKLLANITVTEDELREYFNEHPQMFISGKKARASHILVDTQEKAEDIIKQINDGKSFEDAAKEFSSCPSGKNGGNLSEFGPGAMVPEFEQAAFALNIGEVSSPVKTQFGYHIIKLHNKQEAQNPEFENVVDTVRETYTNIKRQQIYTNKINELKQQYTVEIL